MSNLTIPQQELLLILVENQDILTEGLEKTFKKLISGLAGTTLLTIATILGVQASKYSANKLTDNDLRKKIDQKITKEIQNNPGYFIINAKEYLKTSISLPKTSQIIDHAHKTLGDEGILILYQNLKNLEKTSKYKDLQEEEKRRLWASMIRKLMHSESMKNIVGGLSFKILLKYLTDCDFDETGRVIWK